MSGLSSVPESLLKQPCKCVTCGQCMGNGNMRIGDWRQSEGYDLETCDECRGSGIVEECDRCMQIGEIINEPL